MNPKTITQQLESLNINPDEIADVQVSRAIHLLLQLIEGLHIENEKLKAENQKLRDENSLLKGEQSKPNIPANKKKQKEDISSEDERKKLQKSITMRVK
jgi:cell division protein FtsB